MLNWTEQELNQMLTTPSAALVEEIARIDGDIGILGAGGKMGPTLALLAANACKKAGIQKKIWAISRFSDPEVCKLLEDGGVNVVRMDLLEDGAMERLPELPNIIYMAGKKFGTEGNESETWNMNVSLPTLVCRRFPHASIVVFSSGNIYPQVRVSSGGCTDETKPVPVGEYAMSTLGRERVFESASKRFGTKVLLFRLNYAVDLRYGVLYDLAQKLLDNQTIDLSAGNFNCVWQGYANEVAIRSLLHTATPAAVLNVTGPETVSVRYAAQELGKLLDREPVFSGEEEDRVYLNNAAKCFELFGYPEIPLKRMIRMQAQWIRNGGRVLNIPTHFEERKGAY